MPKPAYTRTLLRLDTHGGKVHANRCTDGEPHAVNNPCIRVSRMESGPLSKCRSRLRAAHIRF
eukprot:1082103-Pyramimonas_sp.AAC.1